MKNIFHITLIAVLSILYSCVTTKSGGDGYGSGQIISTENNSYNEFDLEASNELVSYTIDISTADGRVKLNNLSKKEARKLALTEAVMHYKCATLLNPQYKETTRGKRVLSVTVFGTPAKYKNKK